MIYNNFYFLFSEFGSRFIVMLTDFPVIGSIINKFSSGRTILNKKSDAENIV